MRKFIKRLRKGIRTACLTATLATCWQVGQTAQVFADYTEVQFSGTVSPAVNNISHLYFIYGIGYSGISDRGALYLGDFPAGQATPFSTVANIYIGPYNNDSVWWFAAGLYGDNIEAGYIEGVNGVTLGINGSEGDLWDAYFPYMEESEVFAHLLNGSPENLPSFSSNWNGWNFIGYCTGVEIIDSCTLFDFSQASYNGGLNFESEIIPEPVTIILLGSGGIYVICRRRDND